MIPTTKAEIIALSLKNKIQQLTYPMYQLIIQTAEAYTPTTATDWTALDGCSTAPSTQDSALDYVATSLKNLEANDPDTIITAQGDLIVGDASNNGVPLAVGTANQVLVSDGTDPGWSSTITSVTLTTPVITTNGTIDVSGAGTLGIATSAGANAITIGGSSSNVAIPGVVNADNTTDASAGAGSIVCDGGIYVAKKIVFAAAQQIDCAAGTFSLAASAGANAITLGGGTSNIAVPGVINADNTTDASAGAGSIVCDGGIYVAKKVVFAANQQIDCAAGTFAIGATMGANALTLGGATSSVAVAGSLDVTGTIDADDTTDSSSVATGSIVCDGGVGIAKKLYVGTDLNVAGASTLVGAVGVTGALNVTGQVNANATTQSTSSSTGSLVCDGGVGIAKDVFVAGNLTVADADFCAYTPDDSQMVLDFTKHAITPPVGPGNWGAPSAAQGQVNGFSCMGHHLEVYQTTAQTIGISWDVNGIDISGDQVDNEGLEISCGPLTPDCVKTIGTDNFYFRAKVDFPTDASGSDTFYVGLRKAQAYDADQTNYTDYACVGWNANAATPAIKIMTDLNNAGESATDTTDTISDGEYLDVKIYVGDEARLQTCIDLANVIKASYNGHIADQGVGAEEHDADQGAIATANASDYDTLITLVTDMMAHYVIHNADAILVTPVYHVATGGGDALASEAAPTSLAEAVARLNDLKAKLNLHYADNVAHEDGDTTLMTQHNASSTYFQVGVDGAVGDPTVSAAFDFDTSDTVVPFIYMLQHGDLTGAVHLKNWEIVDVVTAT